MSRAQDGVVFGEGGGPRDRFLRLRRSPLDARTNAHGLAAIWR